MSQKSILAASVAVLSGLVYGTASAAQFAFFGINGSAVTSQERTQFTASTFNEAYNNLATVKPRPVSNDLLQTLHLAGQVTWSLTGTNVRAGEPNVTALADAPGATNGGLGVIPSQDTYNGDSNTISMTLNNPAATLGYDLSGLNLYVLNIFSGAADQRNEYILNMSYSTMDAPTIFTPLFGAFQRFEGSDNKFGSLIQVTFTQAVTGVHSLRLIDQLGTDGTRFRADGQATAFQELDLFGTATPIPEPASLALLTIGGLTMLARNRRRVPTAR